MPSASPFEQQGGICYINNRASDTFGAWGCDDLFCDDDLYTSVSIVPNGNGAPNGNGVANAPGGVGLGNGSVGSHHPMTMTPHLGHPMSSHQLIQPLNQAPLANHQLQQHQQQQQQQQQHQQQPLNGHHLLQQSNNLANPAGDFMAQMHPVNPSPPLGHPQQHHGANNNNTNNINNNNHSTAHKIIPLFAEQSARMGTWEKKLPPDWDENDTTDWIFDLARKLGIPCEYFASCGTSLTGNHLLQMTEEDFQSKYPVHGREFYEAFQQLLRQIHQHGSPLPHQEASPDLLGLQNVSGGLHQNNQQNWANISNGNDMLHHHHVQQLGFERHSIETSPYYYGHHHAAHPDGVAYGSNHVATHEYQTSQGEAYEPYLASDSFDPSENCSNETQSDPEEFLGAPEGGALSQSMKRAPGRPGAGMSRQTSRRRKPDRGYGKLWEFIRDLLHNPLYCPSMVRWEDVNEGVFRIVQSEKLAALWGSIKNNPRMTYEKLSRAMRYYYKSKVFLPVLGRRLVYKFGPHAVLWKPENPNFERPCSDGHQT